MSTSITSSTLGKRTYKIIFLGDSGTGKTSIIERFVNEKFEDKENPTIGIDFLGRNLSYKGSNCRLQLWDTAGQQRFRSLIPTYLKDAICAVFVFDVHNPITLQHIEQWIQMFRQNKGQKTVSVICGNKSDLDMSFDKKELQKLMEKHKMPYHTVSAKSGDNIQNIFYAILDLINELNRSTKGKNLSGTTTVSDVQNPPLTKEPLKYSLNQETDDKTKKIKLENDQQSGKKRFFCC